MLYSPRFGQSVHRLFPGVSCRTQEATQNFEPRPSFNPRWSLALIPLTITEYKFLHCFSSAVRTEPATSRWLSLRSLGNQCLQRLRYVSCWTYFFVNIRIKMKTIVRKPWMIKIIKLRLRNSDNWKMIFKNKSIDVYWTTYRILLLNILHNHVWSLFALNVFLEYIYIFNPVRNLIIIM